jgi:hypothetical protein
MYTQCHYIGSWIKKIAEQRNLKKQNLDFDL